MKKVGGVIFEQLILLNDVTSRIMENKNLVGTSTAILETLKTHLDAYGGVIYFYDKASDSLFTYAFSQNYLINKALGNIVKTWNKYRFLASEETQLISKCFKHDKVYFSGVLSDFYSPVIGERKVNFIQRILGIKLCVVLPIKINGKASGVLFVAFKKKKKLTIEEENLLHFYVNLSSIAISNNFFFEELEQKYEMERETTSMLSHELKTPIAVAHNSAQSVLMSLDKNKSKMDGAVYSEMLKLSNDIQKSMERLNRVCNSIFSLREVEMAVPTGVNELDLEKQLEGVFDLFENRANKKGLVFKYTLVSGQKRVFAPIVQVEQVISILLDNALKYTEQGEICLTAEVKDDKLLVVVTDTGRGIPKSKREMIFGRFYRYTDWSNSYFKKTEGLGLGLYIAKKILNQLKGGITVTNNGKKGSKFCFEVPVYKSKNKKTFES